MKVDTKLDTTNPPLMEAGLTDSVWQIRFLGVDYDLVRRDLREAGNQIRRLQGDRIQRLQQEIVNLWSAINQRPTTVLRYGDLDEHDSSAKWDNDLSVQSPVHSEA